MNERVKSRFVAWGVGVIGAACIAILGIKCVYSRSAWMPVDMGHYFGPTPKRLFGFPIVQLRESSAVVLGTLLILLALLVHCNCFLSNQPRFHDLARFGIVATLVCIGCCQRSCSLERREDTKVTRMSISVGLVVLLFFASASSTFADSLDLTDVLSPTSNHSRIQQIRTDGTDSIKRGELVDGLRGIAINEVTEALFWSNFNSDTILAQADETQPVTVDNYFVTRVASPLQRVLLESTMAMI